MGDALHGSSGTNLKVIENSEIWFTMMVKIKTAFRMNVLIFILEVFAICWMFSGINSGILAASRLYALRYFTVDSNILMGIAALVMAVDEHKVLKGEKREVSQSCFVFKLVGTVGVTLTMLVTVFFLTPTMGPVYGYLSLFSHSNFLLHLLNPVLSIISFVRYEKTDKIAFKHTFTGIVPMLIYAVYYMASAVSHSENGEIAKGYDWYGFFIGGIKSAVIVVPVMLIVTFGISAVLWKLNRLKKS